MAFGPFGHRVANVASSTTSFTSSAVMETLKAQAQNNTSSLTVSAKDVALLGPRLVTRGVNLVFDTIPRRIDGILGMSATMNRFLDSIGLGGLQIGVDGTAATADSAAAARAGADAAGDGLGLGTMRSFAGMFSYMTSRWALVCFTAVCLPNCLHLCPQRSLSTPLLSVSY
jgi:hypothetical protein